VEFEDGRRLIIAAEEVLTRIGKPAPPPKTQAKGEPEDQPD
jgi:hypothetical protein